MATKGYNPVSNPNPDVDDAPNPTGVMSQGHDGNIVRRKAMPDDWLDLEPPLSDSAKYRLCGNAGVSNVVEWIGRRLRAALEAEGARDLLVGRVPPAVCARQVGQCRVQVRRVCPTLLDGPRQRPHHAIRDHRLERR